MVVSWIKFACHLDLCEFHTDHCITLLQDDRVAKPSKVSF